MIILKDETHTSYQTRHLEIWTSYFFFLFVFEPLQVDAIPKIELFDKFFTILHHKNNQNFRNVARFKLDTCPQIKTLRLDGSIYFASVDHIQDRLRRLIPKPNESSYFVLVCSGVNFIDFAGKEMIVCEMKRIQSQGGRLVFCGFKNTLIDDLKDSGYLDIITQENIYADTSQAVSSLMTTINPARCINCQQRIFSSCPEPAQGKT